MNNNWATYQEELIGLPVVGRSSHALHFGRSNKKVDAYFTGAPCHYLENREWKPIDTTLQLSTDGFYGAPGLDVLIHPSGHMKIGKYHHRVKLPGDPIGKVDGNKIIREFKGGCHSMYLTEVGYREEVLLEKPMKAKCFIPSTSGKLSPKFTRHPIVAEDKNEDIFVFAGDVPAFDKWLANAAYPVIIDPDYLDDVSDGHIRGDHPTNYETARSTSGLFSYTGVNMTCANILTPGLYGEYYVYRDVLAFDTSSIMGNPILQTKLVIVPYTAVTTWYIGIKKYDWSALEADPTNATKRETAYDGLLAASFDSSNFSNMTVQYARYYSGELDTAWVNPIGKTYYGLISSDDMSDITPIGYTNQVYLGSQNNPTVAYRPTLYCLIEMPWVGPWGMLLSDNFCKASTGG